MHLDTLFLCLRISKFVFEYVQLNQVPSWHSFGHLNIDRFPKCVFLETVLISHYKIWLIETTCIMFFLNVVRKKNWCDTWFHILSSRKWIGASQVSIMFAVHGPQPNGRVVTTTWLWSVRQMLRIILTNLRHDACHKILGCRIYTKVRRHRYILLRTRIWHDPTFLYSNLIWYVWVSQGITHCTRHPIRVQTEW